MTVPRRIREALRIRPGDRIDFVLSEAGEVTLRAATVDVSTLKGVLRRPGRKPVSLREMEGRRGTDAGCDQTATFDRALKGVAGFAPGL